MPRTTAYASEMHGQPDHAVPLLRIDGEWRPSPLVKTDRTMHAAGGMGTTARDAARWLILNIDRGTIDGRRILHEEMAREYFAQQSELSQPQGRIRIEEGFALGWQVGKYRERTRPHFSHGGGYVGAASLFCFLPDERIGVAVLANSNGGSDMATIASIDVLDRLLGVKGEPDLLPVYEEQAKQRRAENPGTPAGALNPARAPDGLSLPATKYTGTFIHPIDGELEIFTGENGDLAARMGDLPFVLYSRGTDQFTAWVVPGMVDVGRFEIGTDGTVDAVVLESESTPTRFERAARR